MCDKLEQMLADRDANARLAARAMVEGNNPRALRFAARFASVEVEIARALEELVS